MAASDPAGRRRRGGIAAEAGAPIEPAPVPPVIRGKLITGDESVSLEADIAGGGGEGVASLDYLWWPPQKIAGKYLTAELTGRTAQAWARPQSMESTSRYRWARIGTATRWRSTRIAEFGSTRRSAGVARLVGQRWGVQTTTATTIAR